MCPSARAGRRAHRAAAVARLGGLGLGLGVAMSCRASALIDVMSAACLTLSPAPAESPLPPAPRCCTLAAELCSSSSSLTRRAVHGGCSLLCPVLLRSLLLCTVSCVAASSPRHRFPPLRVPTHVCTPSQPVPARSHRTATRARGARLGARETSLEHSMIMTSLDRSSKVKW